MSEERRRILLMLAQGKITPEEAEDLLAAVGASKESAAETRQSVPAPVLYPVQKAKPRFLRVIVHGASENVDVRVPLALIRAGVKLGTLIPGNARIQVNQALNEKGIQLDLGALDPKSLDEFVEAFAEMSVHVQDANQHVRVFCE